MQKHEHNIHLYRYQAPNEGGGTVEAGKEHGGVQEVHAAKREAPGGHTFDWREGKKIERYVYDLI